ncbi:MAG: DinB family protein [Acidobacteriota bacterium]
MVAIDQLADIRRVLGKVVSIVESADLFRIPPGFANHIAWNAAHVVVTQQMLQYRLSNLEPHVPAALLDRYRKGTQPEDGDEASYRAVMDYLERTPQMLADDYAQGRFMTFTPYTTSAGFELASIEDAISFNNFHEGIHLGCIMALRKALAASGEG